MQFMGKIIVIGGSAGSIAPLCTVLEMLPRGFPAPVMVVIHVGEGNNRLPEVSQRCTKLRVNSPGRSERIVQNELARNARDPQARRRHRENAAAAAEDMRLLRQILARL